MRCIFVLLLFITVAAAAASTGPESYSKAVAEAAMLLAKGAPAVPDAEARRDLTCQLAKTVKEIQPADLHAEFIDKIAALLNDDSNPVVMCATIALANIGLPAARALPAMWAAADRELKEEYGDHWVSIAETGSHLGTTILFAAWVIEGQRTADGERDLPLPAPE